MPSPFIGSYWLGGQGSPVDLGGYYRPDEDKTFAVMRPSGTLNEVLATLG